MRPVECPGGTSHEIYHGLATGMCPSCDSLVALVSTGQTVRHHVLERPATECRTCRYSDPTVLSNVDDTGPAAVLLCRRYPPVPVYEADTEGTAPSWPLVHEQEWCGEWKETDRG